MSFLNRMFLLFFLAVSGCAAELTPLIISSKVFISGGFHGVKNGATKVMDGGNVLVPMSNKWLDIKFKEQNLQIETRAVE